jgi:hypothetical protein
VRVVWPVVDGTGTTIVVPEMTVTLVSIPVAGSLSLAEGVKVVWAVADVPGTIGTTTVVPEITVKLVSIAVADPLALAEEESID